MKHEEKGGAGFRLPRLEASILEELGAILRDDVTDPVLEGVQLTAVVLSVDYKNARAHFVMPHGGVRAEIEKALVRATPFMRARLGEAIELKRTPELRFVFETELPA